MINRAPGYRGLVHHLHRERLGLIVSKNGSRFKRG